MKNNKTYFIFIRSNKHPRSYYSRIDFIGTREELKTKVTQLRASGEVINKICTPLGLRIWL